MAIFLLALVAGTALLQVSLPVSYLPLDGVFLVLVFSGLQRGRGMGFLVGAFGGLILDCLASPQLGPRMVAGALVGALADAAEGLVNREQPRLQLLAVAALSALHDAVIALSARWMHLEQGGIRRIVLEYALPRLALHALLAVPLYYFFRAVVRSPVFQSASRMPPRIIRKLPR